MQGLSLTQSLKQQQRLSPAQIQVVKMLELPSVDLLQRINEELQENPALEEGKEEQPGDYEKEMQEEEGYDGEYDNPLQNDDFNYDDYVSDDESLDYRGAGMSAQQTEAAEIPITAGTSFGEYLKSQVYLTHMNKAERHIAKFVVWNIDEDGYLRRTAEELCDDMAFREGLIVSEEEMKRIISEIQGFDPPGVGAYNLQECLLIQLRQKPPTPVIERAIEIIEKDFDNFSHRRLERIQQLRMIDEEELKAVMREIGQLNPKPGSAWVGTVYDRQQTTVIPDFIVSNIQGELTIQLNDGDVPDLKVNESYSQMLSDLSDNKAKTAKQKETLRFIRQKVDAAHWFIDAIRQRNETLMRVMGAIVKSQRGFFEQGDVTLLKPMVLQEIADKTGYDVSTISRVSNSKYVQTDFGIYPVKYFFTDRMTTVSGEEISNEEVKKSIRELIDNEDKRNPLTDQDVVEEMKKKGYVIARRTVAKYRDQYKIPVARLRKDI
ncbi:MAG: RNA polymerase factor sigma-54 [Paludibacteraceae bacterium]|nr:RNA polymerase factor sigma-54 [Paludibacteraceae bacterium]